MATAKILTLEDEVKAAKDQVLRAMADAENARVIARRDIANEREYAIKNFAKSLLEVADNLERAVESVPAEARDKDAADASPVLLALLEGVEMTSAGLLKAFAEAKVAKVGEIGDKFDPAFHEVRKMYTTHALTQLTRRRTQDLNDGVEAFEAKGARRATE